MNVIVVFMKFQNLKLMLKLSDNGRNGSGS